MNKFIFLAIFMIFTNNLCAQKNDFSFAGNVYDYQKGEPIYGANIMLKNSNNHYTKTKNGFFKIDSLNEEVYFVTVSYMGYLSVIDTIHFSSKKKYIGKSYYLKFRSELYTVEQTPKFEKYHIDLHLSAQDKEIVEFTIDSLVYNNFTLSFWSSFKNNTALPIYILQENECIKPFTFNILNSEGKYVRQNGCSLSCDDRGLFNIDSTDLVEIAPHSTYKYGKTAVWLYSFKSLPKDEYTINISYEYKSPMRIVKYRFQMIEEYSSNIYAARIGLRGKYKSINTLKFSN